MVRQNSVNKRARYEHGTDRLVQSYFHDEKSIQRRLNRRGQVLNDQTKWEMMTPEEKKQFVLYKYGPGKKHNGLIALKICYHEKKKFSYLMDGLINASTNRTVSLSFTFVLEKPMNYRLDRIHRIIINYRQKWINVLLKKDTTQIRCRKTNQDKNTWEYRIKVFAIGLEYFNEDPFLKLSYILENNAQTKEADYEILIQPVKNTKEDTITKEKSCIKKDGVRLVISVERDTFDKLLKESLVTLSGNIYCTTKEIPRYLSKVYCVCEDDGRMIQADFDSAKSYILIASNGYRYNAKIYNIRVVPEISFNSRSLITTSSDDNGYNIALYI